MKIKSFLLAVFTGCFLLLSFQTEAQKSNILIEKGLAYLSTSQSSTKGYNPEVGVSIDPENLYQMSKTPGDWGGAGISALCLQAFLQDGHNIDDPLYATIVQNGIDYLLGTQVSDPGNYHYGAFGSSGSFGYETAMCIFTLQLALETPLAGGGFISGTLRTEIEDAVAAGLNYYTQDINEAWNAVSWRYNRGYTGEYSGDMSVNQWVFLALDALDYSDKGVWTKIYNYLQGRKCSSGDYSYIGYQTCGTRPQGMTCAGIWGAVLTGSHGVMGASGLKTEFLNYLENFTLSQLIDLSSIGSSQIYIGGGYYYYLYGFSKALALSNKTNISGGNCYNYLYTTIESLHKTDANTNYYWDDWGGNGANMETALALLALQTQEVPVGSTLKVSLNTNPGGPKSDCFDFMVFDELGNEAGFNGTNWFTNIPLSEWTSTTNDLYELTIEVQESTNYSVQVENTCLTPQSAELCYQTYLQDELTDEECFLLEDTPPFTPIGATGFVNAIGGLNVIIVVPPTPIPQMQLSPTIVSFNPFEYSHLYEFSFEIAETGGETPLLDIDVFASDLTDQFGNVIPAGDITVSPEHFDLIDAGTSQTVDVSFTTPATLSFDPGLFTGLVTIQTPDQAKAVNIELGSPDMIIDPDAVMVPYTSGSTSFDIDFTGLVGAGWEITSDAAWAVPDMTTGSGDAMITVDYEANNSDQERTATLTISAPDALNTEETFTITQEGAPFVFFNYVDLEGSTNMMDWWNVPGNLADGFDIGLNLNLDTYYLNLGDQTETNLPLAEDMFPFYLDPMSVPDGFWEYWAGRGVVEGATGWQGVMWDIINGVEPTFYIKVESVKANQIFSLVDGLQYLFGGTEEFLMVPSDYPLGTYDYFGFVESDGGIPSEQIDVMITFWRPEILSAELLVSQDMGTWENAFGNIMDGYLVRLDEMVDNYYLNMGETTTNVPIINDMYPFFLDPQSVPDGFWDYWAAKGVIEGATGWQGVMWDIINGLEPTFYIVVSGEGVQTFSLMDGLQYLFGGNEEYLMVPGDYPLGSYMYYGTIMGEYEVPSDVIPIMITFASDIDQQVELMEGWLGISSYIIPENPALEVVLGGIADDMVILVSNGGIYWPSQNINLIGDWNTYEGYKIKIINPTLLEFFGFPADPVVDLPGGISFMPVLSADPMTTDVFTEMGDNLIYAFNLQEQTVFWPEGGLNTIGTIEPGVGYLVNLVGPQTVDFSTKTTTTSQHAAPFVNESPWPDVVNTGNPHIISITGEALGVLDAGDYIGLFGANGEIAGITEFVGGKENLQLIAYGDDFTTPEVDGLAQGEMMDLMVYKANEDQVYHLQATFDSRFNGGQFEAGAVSMITELKVGALGVPGSMETQFSAFPNPTTGQLNITSNEHFDIHIINAAGQVVFETNIAGDAVLNLSFLEKGVYLIKASNEQGLIIDKLIIK